MRREGSRLVGRARQCVIPLLLAGGLVLLVVASGRPVQPFPAAGLVQSPSGAAVCGQAGELENPAFSYFPLFQSIEDGFFGYAVSNGSEATVGLELRAIDSSGQLVPSAQNPAHFELAPQEQLALQGSQIFGPESMSGPAWIQVLSDSPETGSFFEIGSSSLEWMDGAVAQEAVSQQLFFTRIFSGEDVFHGRDATTTLTLANPNPVPVELRLEYRPFVQESAESIRSLESAAVATFSLPACGLVRDTVAGILGAGVGQGYIVVDVLEGPGVIGFEWVEFSLGETTIGLNAMTASSSLELFSAQLASVPNQVFTNVNLINTSQEQRDLALSLFGEGGGDPTRVVQVTLDPGEQVQKDAADLFALEGPIEGSLHVVSSGEGVIGDVIFGDPLELRYAAALALQQQQFLEAIFSQVASLADFFTGLALYRPGEGKTEITIEVFSASGQKTGEATVELAAGARIAELLADLIPAVSGQSGGWIRIRSSRGLVAQEIFGDTQLRLLAAVPPKINAIEVPSNSPYLQWENGPSPDPDYFPIGVWLQSPARAQQYQDIGINLYVGLFWQEPMELQEQLQELANAQMPAIIFQNFVGRTSPLNYVIQGWTQDDEPDNAQPDGHGGYGPCIPPNELISYYNQLRGNDPTRPVFMNFGQGVAFIDWVGRGSCKGDTSYYPLASQAADIVSFDIYPVTNSNPTVQGNLEFVGQGVANLVEWAGEGKIVWNFIETTHIKDPTHRPTPDQIKSEVWMSLINGSTGIMYFVHEWEPSFREDGIFRYPEVVEGVRQINAEILDLAPVLNSPTIPDLVTLETEAPLAVMAKRYGGRLYLFAVAMTAQPFQASFALDGQEDGQLEVLGESRSVDLTEGQFEDDFSAYQVHLYRSVP